VRITDEAGIEPAFAAAAKLAQRAVLVEGWVAGDDHRLAVVAGRFAWAARRSPPRVTGDGEHTVRQLVDRENARRRSAPDRDLAGAPIVIDAEAEALVASQGHTLDTCPPAGTIVALGLVANQARGGTIADCTDVIHPDNRAMAEAIARAFHLDTTGIDFMTPDITRSWREVPCAVIEINVTPGFSSDARAELILARRFAPGTDGRVPGVLLVGAPPGELALVAAALAGEGRVVGSTDGSVTLVGAEQRFSGDVVLPDRAMALVLDPACEAIVIAASPAEIAAHGLPLDRFDVALVGEGAGLSPAALALLRDCCRAVQEGVKPGGFAGAALAALEQWNQSGQQPG
jgi:cyanophycin synthetase